MSLNSNSPVGIFDSGIGGISIARCIEKMLPNEQLIYFADSQYAPYGDKSRSNIIARVNHVADSLVSQGVKAIVVACNTATVNAIEQLRSRIDVPIIGVEPAIKPAVASSERQRIGILVTSATAVNQRFISLVERYKGNADVHIQPCPGLVQLIEQGKHDDLACELLLRSLIEPLLEKGIDRLVLGCTHYPLISDKIAQISGADVAIDETSVPVSKELSRRLARHSLLANGDKPAPHRIISTLPSQQQTAMIQHFWPSQLIFSN